MVQCLHVEKILNLKLHTFVAKHSSIALSSVNVTIGQMDIMKFANNDGENLVHGVNSTKVL